MKTGEYQDADGNWKSCKIVRQGRNHTRIELPDGSRLLLPSRKVRVSGALPPLADHLEEDLGDRIVPEVPLQRLYKTLRSLKGSRNAMFIATEQILNARGVRCSSVFIAELFQRSVEQMQCYKNEAEGFYSQRAVRTGKDYKFANALVESLGRLGSHELGDATIKMIDYEIYPLRTTESVRDDGKSAKSRTSGTMDALLAVSFDGLTLPGIGEIKAKSEQVGVTFALIQALMNASLLSTESQFRRLKYQPEKEYAENFADLVCERPRVDIVLMIDERSKLIARDVQLASELRLNLEKSLCKHIRSVRFLKATKDAEFELFK